LEAVRLICSQYDVHEDRLREHHPSAVSGRLGLMSVPVMSLGMVGRELDAEEFQDRAPRHRDEQRFHQSRHADDQTVAAGKQRQSTSSMTFPADDELMQLGGIESCPAPSRSARTMSSEDQARERNVVERGSRLVECGSWGDGRGAAKRR
jgi:hypothetical protein